METNSAHSFTEGAEVPETNSIKHTPTPWEIRYSGGIDFIISSGYGKIVEAIFPNVNIDSMDEHEEQWTANGKFIVEACNNYYSLKEQLSSYESKYNDQCKRIDELNSQLADKEERIVKLYEALDNLYLAIKYDVSKQVIESHMNRALKALNP
jgi:uncharacterized coiled-coil protein SlyX